LLSIREQYTAGKSWIPSFASYALVFRKYGIKIEILITILIKFMEFLGKDRGFGQNGYFWEKI